MLSHQAGGGRSPPPGYSINSGSSREGFGSSHFGSRASRTAEDASTPLINVLPICCSVNDPRLIWTEPLTRPSGESARTAETREAESGGGPRLRFPVQLGV